MDFRDPSQMDEAIRTMLDAGPLEAVPSGFGRKVKVRVTLAAMLDWERQRWRYVSGAGAAGLAGLAAAIGVVAAFPQVLEWAFRRLIPGGAGYADYLVSQAWYGSHTLAAVVSVGALTAAAALGYLIQRVRSWSCPMGRS